MKLYPKIKPYNKLHYEVDKLKDGTAVKLYVQMWGNKNGYPVLYLHGGPGDRITDIVPRLYDPKKYNIIAFDQRGCGKSLPKTQLEKNTTKLLIQDIERIRDGLATADKWLVTGGSWGASLSVLYAQAYPERVSGLILRGFTDLSTHNWNNKEEFSNPGRRSLWPDRIDKIYKSVGLNYLKDTEYNWSRKTLKKSKTNRKTKKKLVNTWISDQDMSIDKIKFHDSSKDKEQSFDIDLHYITNKFFIKKNQIINEVNKIKDIPTIMVVGRYDVICPPIISYEFNKKLNNSELIIVDKAGHTMHERNIQKELVDASNRIYKKLK